MMNGDERRPRDAFRQWATDAGAPRNAATLAAAIGIPAEDLSGRLREYLGRFK